MLRNTLLICILFLFFSTLNAQYTSTTASRVQTDFDANWISSTYPRLFGSTSEIQRIKNLYNAGDVLVKKTVDQIISEANNALTATIPVWGLDAANLRVSGVHTISKDFVPELIISYQITGDEKYAKRAWQVAKVLMTYQDWGVATTSPYRDRHFLDAGIGAFLIKVPDKKLSRESFSIAGGIVLKIFLIESDGSNRWPSRSIIPHG